MSRTWAAAVQKVTLGWRRPRDGDANSRTSVLAGAGRAVEVLEVLGVRDDLRDDDKVHRHTPCWVSVEVVRQPPVRCAGGHDEPGQGGGHDGAVGEPPEWPVVGAGGEFGPRRQHGCRLVETRAGEYAVGSRHCCAPQTGIRGWAHSPAGPPVDGPNGCPRREVCRPGRQMAGARLSREVK